MGGRALRWAVLGLVVGVCPGVWADPDAPDTPYALQEIRVVAGGHPVRESPEGLLMAQAFRSLASCEVRSLLGAGMGNSLAATVAGQVEIEVRAMSCRDLPPPPLGCRWRVTAGGEELHRGEAETLGWRLRFPVPVPAIIGEAVLHLDCGTAGARRSLERAFFVTYRAPTPLVTVLLPPRQTWYQLAVHWGAGFRHDATEEEVLDRMLAGLYRFGAAHWRYGSFPSPATRNTQSCFENGFCFCNWQLLVQADQPCNFANCYQFADVWEGITATLGIGGYNYIITTGSAEGGLVTEEALRSFDGDFVTTNLCPRTDFCPSYFFSSHNLRRRDGLIYDPTFGRTYRNLAQAIALNPLPRVEEEDCRRVADDPTLELCPLGTGYDSWSQWEIVHRSPLQTGSEPAFSQDVTYRFSNAENLTLHEGLLVDLTVENLPAGARWQVLGTLSKDGRIIADRYAWDTPAFSTTAAVADDRPVGVELRFSGEQIYRARQDGPFLLKVVLLDGEGGVTTLEQRTPPFRWQDFGEVQATLLEVGARVLREGGGGRHGVLQTEARLEVRKPGLVVLQGRLAGDGRTLAYTGGVVEEGLGEAVVTLVQPLETEALEAATASRILTLTLEIYDRLLQTLDSETVRVRIEEED